MNKVLTPSKNPQRQEGLVVYKIDLLTKQEELLLFSFDRDHSGVLREINEVESILAQSNPFLLTFLAGYASIPLPRSA